MSDVQAQLEQLADLVSSPAARSRAGAELARLGLEGRDHEDDVLQLAYARVVGRIRRRGPLDDVSSDTLLVIRSMALDLAGGQSSFPRFGTAWPEDRPATLGPAGVEPAITPETLRAVRDAVVDALSPAESWQVSAAISLLTMRAFSIAPHPDAPWLLEDPAHNEECAAIWGAGRDCFTDVVPSDGVETEAGCELEPLADGTAGVWRRRRDVARLRALIWRGSVEVAAGHEAV